MREAAGGGLWRPAIPPAPQTCRLWTSEGELWLNNEAMRGRVNRQPGAGAAVRDGELPAAAVGVVPANPLENRELSRGARLWKIFVNDLCNSLILGGLRRGRG